MCFAPQRRALFRHLKCQKWSAPGVFCTFWLGNVLRATTACNFSSLLWPAGSAPAALASLLFDPPEQQIIGKQSESRLSYLFAHLHLLSYSFSSTLLSSDLSLLSASSLLCFSSVHIVGSLTSKLPPIISTPQHWLRVKMGWTWNASEVHESSLKVHQEGKVRAWKLDLLGYLLKFWSFWSTFCNETRAGGAQSGWVLRCRLRECAALPCSTGVDLGEASESECWLWDHVKWLTCTELLEVRNDFPSTEYSPRRCAQLCRKNHLCASRPCLVLSRCPRRRIQESSGRSLFRPYYSCTLPHTCLEQLFELWSWNASNVQKTPTKKIRRRHTHI